MISAIVTSAKTRYINYLSGGIAFLALAFAVAWFSARPVWQSIPPDSGVVRLSFTHSGARNCRDITAEELAKLPANMRASQICERRRQPIWLEFAIDNVTVKAQDYLPSGLFGSGPSRVYERLLLKAGSHQIQLRMRDTPASPAFTHTADFDIMLNAGESIAIDFDGTANGFFLHGKGGS